MSAAAAYRRLMHALLAWFVAHAIGMAATLPLLMPGMSPARSAAERAAFVAGWPWLWRLGWLPWQLSAVSDLAVAVLLWRWLRESDAGKRGAAWALAGIAATVLGAGPDLSGEVLLIGSHISVARDVVSGVAPPEAFVRSEHAALLLNAVYANGGYLLATALWTAAASSHGRKRRGRDGARERGLLASAAITIIVFALASALTYRAVAPGAVADLGAAVPLTIAGFVSLFVWGVCFAGALGRTRAADRPAADDELHRLRWPGRGARLFEELASRGMRDVVRPLPFVELASDIRDVVYLNWLVPAERVRQLLPPPLRLHCLGDRTAISILSYAHGDFGPRFLGPLRRILPSPIQSNWRLYVEPPEEQAEKRDAIYFVKTVLSSAPHVIASRLLADGLPAHLAAHMSHERDGDAIRTILAGGSGSAPDLRATVVTTGDRVISGEFARAFDGWDEAVLYLVEQNRAVAVRPDGGDGGGDGGVFESRIDIPIAIADVVPASVEGTIESELLAPLVAGCAPFAFIVPQVPFRALGEREIGPREKA